MADQTLPTGTSDGFVDVPGNPRPEGAEIIWFKGTGGRDLRACIAPALDPGKARGTCIVCPGRTEYIEKYFEVARDLQARGFAVVILDWPGQGLSERLLEDGLKGHIDRFETYMGALSNGLDALQDRLPQPYVSLAHSMGGAIAMAAISEKLVDVKAAAFCAPMWGLKTRIFGMRYLVWAMRVTGRGDSYAMQPGPPERFKDNVVTHDEARWQLNRELVEAAPGLDLGPITWGWLGASLNIIAAFGKKANLKQVDIPIFVASASDEQLVDNSKHERFASLLPNVEHITVDGAYHEILMETDDKREEFWAGFERMLERAGV